jgi:hypothetical protein
VRYDATPPDLGSPETQPGDGFSLVRWGAPGDGATVVVTRTPGLGRAARSVVFRGEAGAFIDRRVTNGRTYRYDVRAVDQAGNATTLRLGARPGRRLVRPGRGAHVAGPPVLRWTAVPRARYYNVQLHRDGRKVLSAWPTRARLRLKDAWRYAGRRQHLSPGTYRWHVWPGRGPREARRFGPLIGTRTFVVAAPPPVA